MLNLEPNKKVVYTLFSLYLLLMFLLSFNPIERNTWFIENLTVWILVGTLVYLYIKKIRFSTLSYCLAAIFIFLHTIGGHYTFAKVPFDFVTNLFDFSRNHFDRVAHFSVGLYAFPIAEWIKEAGFIKNKFLLFTYPIFAIMSVAALYEIIEWIYAAETPAKLALAYLGSQGDIWDAQKDMLADTLGAIVAVIIFFIRKNLFLKN